MQPLYLFLTLGKLLMGRTASRACDFLEQCSLDVDEDTLHNELRFSPELGVSAASPYILSMVRDCPMRFAYIFFSLARKSAIANDVQRSHNLNQLAMAMVWEVSRKDGECLGAGPIFAINWLSDFMPIYLSLAAQLSRHETDPVPGRRTKRILDPSKIAVATVCDYNTPNHVLYGIDKISAANRDQYIHRHGYTSIFKSVNEDAAGRHPVWAAIALPLRLLRSGHYDYVMWMDCDALFVDQSVKLETLIVDPDIDLYISEDGRGLSGGNWIIRYSDWSIKFLDSIYSNSHFDQFDLKDQFGLLWTLLSGSIFEPYNTTTRNIWGYPSNVGLLPQRLINAYPWSLCRPSHHCFEDSKDFIVSFITLGSQSREMAWNLLMNFYTRN
jgi:hypothetical protein